MYIERRKLFYSAETIANMHNTFPISVEKPIYIFASALMTKWFVPNLEYVFAEFAVLCVFLSLLFK
jgi:hypothetical protein